MFRYPEVSRKEVHAYRDQTVELGNLLEIIDVRVLRSGVLWIHDTVVGRVKLTLMPKVIAAPA